jgi:hypothetical protein
MNCWRYKLTAITLVELLLAYVLVLIIAVVGILLHTEVGGNEG